MTARRTGLPARHLASTRCRRVLPSGVSANNESRTVEGHGARDDVGAELVAEALSDVAGADVAPPRPGGGGDGDGHLGRGEHPRPRLAEELPVAREEPEREPGPCDEHRVEREREVERTP
jgi:hypothetical protein